MEGGIYYGKIHQTLYADFCASNVFCIYSWLYRSFYYGNLAFICKFTTVTDAKFVGFSNYIEALKDTAFRHSFWYTVLFAIASLLIINIIAFALAMALTKEMHGTNVFRTVFFMPT